MPKGPEGEEPCLLGVPHTPSSFTCLRSRLISPSRQGFQERLGDQQGRPQHSTERAHIHDLVLIGRELPLTEGNPFHYDAGAGLFFRGRRDEFHRPNCDFSTERGCFHRQGGEAMTVVQISDCLSPRRNPLRKWLRQSGRLRGRDWELGSRLLIACGMVSATILLFIVVASVASCLG